MKYYIQFDSATLLSKCLSIRMQNISKSDKIMKEIMEQRDPKTVPNSNPLNTF
jgi:hypothetical protein